MCEDTTEKDLKEKSDNDSSLTKGEELAATFKDAIGEAVENPADSAPVGTLDKEEFEEIASDIDVDCIEYVDYKNDPYEIFFYWKNGKVGIMDKNGGIIEEARWDFLSHNEPYDQIFVFDNKLAAKYNGGSDFGIYPNGYWVKKDGALTEDNYSGCGGPVETEELYWHEKDGKAYVFTVLLGQTINFTEYSYNAVSQSDWFDSFDSFRFIQPIDGVESNEDRSPRKTSEKYALFDIKTGKVISDYIYDDKYVINDNVALVEQDGIWRMIDYTGKYVNNCVYDNPHGARYEEFDVGQRNAFVYCNGYIVTKSNGKFGLADEYGNQIIGHEYENISFVSDDGIFGIQTDDGRWALFRKR